MQLVLAVLLMAACGASSAQVATAKSAEYKAPLPTILDLAREVAAENYVIDGQAANAFVTRWQWYSREGGRQSPGADGLSQISEGSVSLQLLVEVVDVGLSRVAVTVTPRVLQVVIGSPKPRTLEPDDPSMPPWVHGRVDALSLAIYERAKKYIEKP